MHIYFSGIGGAGIGPLAMIAHQAGYNVSGSDKRSSQYTDYLEQHGIELHIGQSREQIAAEHANNPIDWIVFSSAVLIEDQNHPELVFAKEQGIKFSKRDECLNKIISDKNLKLVAIAGTHGKTTTTALTVWMFKELGIPVSYSVGAKIGNNVTGKAQPMGLYDEHSQYFVYECDEFDRNFLSFNPYLSVITVVDWDHHDIYKTRESYQQAFRDFIGQSQNAILLKKDAEYLGILPTDKLKILPDNEADLGDFKLAGLHNRQNAFVAVGAMTLITGKTREELAVIANRFPGSSRRFERLAENIYSDYAHTPEEIAATIQLARELSDNVVVVYEPLTNRRQHYMKDLYNGVFEPVKKVYWLPSYLARENPGQTVLTPKDLVGHLSQKTNAQTADMGPDLLKTIKAHAASGDLVICMAGGGGDSLDEWLRKSLV